MNIIFVLIQAFAVLCLFLYIVDLVGELGEAKMRLARLAENQMIAGHIAIDCYNRLHNDKDSFVRKDDTLLRLHDLLTVYGYYPPDDDSDS
jgi:hypothetical protein